MRPSNEALERYLNLFPEVRWDRYIEDDWSKWEDPEYCKRIDRANRLFGKYWMHLWD